MRSDAEMIVFLNAAQGNEFEKFDEDFSFDREVVAQNKAAEWQNREQNLRETEWAMHERAIAAAKRGLDAYMEKEKVYTNLADIARMLEAASKLGRLATGMGDGEKQNQNQLPTVRVEVILALEKIYGQAELGTDVETRRREGAEIIDVERMKIGGQG